LAITDVDVGTGALSVTLSAELKALLPEPPDSGLTAYTAREGDLVFAISACERN
jgi:hypothetical protein